MIKKAGILMMFTALLMTYCSKKEELPTVFPKLTVQEIEDLKKKVQALPNDPVTEDEKAVINTPFGTIEFEFYPDEDYLDEVGYIVGKEGSFYLISKQKAEFDPNPVKKK